MSTTVRTALVVAMRAQVPVLIWGGARNGQELRDP